MKTKTELRNEWEAEDGCLNWRVIEDALKEVRRETAEEIFKDLEKIHTKFYHGLNGFQFLYGELKEKYLSPQTKPKINSLRPIELANPIYDGLATSQEVRDKTADTHSQETDLMKSNKPTMETDKGIKSRPDTLRGCGKTIIYLDEDMTIVILKCDGKFLCSSCQEKNKK